MLMGLSLLSTEVTQLAKLEGKLRTMAYMFVYVKEEEEDEKRQSSIVKKVKVVYIRMDGLSGNLSVIDKGESLELRSKVLSESFTRHK